MTGGGIGFLAALCALAAGAVHAEGPFVGWEIDSLVSSAYRDTAWEGRVEFIAALHVNEVRHPLGTLAAEFRIGDAWRPAGTFDAGVARLSVDVAELPRGEREVAFRIRPRAGGEPFATAALRFTRTDAAPVRKAWVDARHRLVVDGRPFFPLGMYNWDNRSLADYTNIAFNCMLTSGSKGWADLLQRHGLKMIAGVARPNDTADAALARAEPILRHPAVIAWYTADEPPPALRPLKEGIYRAFRASDPDHPVYGVFDKTYHVRGYLAAFDVIGMDPYPVGNRKVLEGMEMATAWARRCAHETFGIRPMWQVPQAFNWRRERKGDLSIYREMRFPNAAEFRSLAYQSIAAGANGLVWFRFESVLSEHAFEWVKATVDEIARYVPVFLADPAETAVPSDPAVTVRCWSADGATWVLAANTKESAVAAHLAIRGGAGSVAAAFCDGAAAKAGDGVGLSLRPLGAALLKVSQSSR